MNITQKNMCGSINYAERFDGKEAGNEELYDGLNTRNYNGRVYCRRCDKYLGNKETNVISKKAEKALAEEMCKNTSKYI